MAYKFQLGDAILSGALTQEGQVLAKDAATFQSTVTVTGEISGASDLDIGGNAEAAGTLRIVGASTLEDTLQVNGKGTFAGRLDVTGGVEMASTLLVKSESTLSGVVPYDATSDIGAISNAWRAGYFDNLYANTEISGNELQGELQYSASADLEGGIAPFRFINGAHASVALKGYTSFSNDQVLRWDGVGYQFVDSSIADDGASVGIDADTSITGTLEVASAANLASTLDVAGIMSGASDLLIGGQFDLEGNAIIEGKVVADHISASAESEMAAIMPAATLSHDLGSSTLEWRDVYARTLRASLRVSASSYRGPLESSASADLEGGIQAFTFDNSSDATVALKNYTAFSDNAIMVWDGSNYQFRDSSIADDATSVSINAHTSVTGTLAVSNAVDLASTLDVAGIISGASDLQIGGNADVDGNFSVDGNLTLGSGLASSEVEFQAAVSSSFVPSIDSSFDLGTSAFRWSTLYVDNIIGADLALDVDTDTTFGAGVDVLLANGTPVTLPACSQGKVIRIKNVSAGRVRVDRAGTDDIFDDETGGAINSFELETRGAAVSLIGSGSTWYIF